MVIWRIKIKEYMSVQSVLAAALVKAKTFSSGTLTYNGESVTVYKSFVRHQTREMKEIGYEPIYDDLHVMAKPEDIADWDLVPAKSEVTVDDVAYIIGKTVTETPGYVTIFLRLKR